MNITLAIEAHLQELGMACWPIWEKEMSQFPLEFDEKETAYMLEGEIIVTPVGGEPVRIVPGDLVVFPEGLDTHWQWLNPYVNIITTVKSFVCHKGSFKGCLC